MYTFAAIQMDLTLLKPDDNLNKIVRLANEAADLGAAGDGLPRMRRDGLRIEC